MSPKCSVEREREPDSPESRIRTASPWDEQSLDQLYRMKTRHPAGYSGWGCVSVCLQVPVNPEESVLGLFSHNLGLHRWD